MADPNVNPTRFNERLELPGPVRAAKALLWEDYGSFHIGLEVEAPPDLPPQTEIDLILFDDDGDELLRITTAFDEMQLAEPGPVARYMTYFMQVTETFLELLGGWSVGLNFEEADTGEEPSPSGAGAAEK